MDAAILAYNLEATELKKLKKICRGKGVRVRTVTPEDCAQPVGALCGVEKRTEASNGAAPDEKMLVLAHLTGGQLDSLLSEIRTARIAPDALKAVLTPSNAKWSAVRLAEELKKERDSLAQGVPQTHQ